MTATGFRHEALLYEGESEFLVAVVPFIRLGLERREPVLVVEPAARLDALRRELGEDSSLVTFADMAGVGANPARIVPAWRDFVDGHAGAPALRGVGEPIWAARAPDELAECQRHESLLNVAFGGGRPWRLLCPYDTSELPAAVIDEARRSHEYVVERHVERVSPSFRGDDGMADAAPLTPPPAGARSLSFARGDLSRLRSLVAEECAAAGLDAQRADDFVAAANEVATNSLVHGGGAGSALTWHDETSLLCEIRDRGRLADPLAGRRRPARSGSPVGLWLANQLCDLVQVRTHPTGMAVRLVMRRRQPAGRGGWSWAAG